jgi:hypothetical protein
MNLVDVVVETFPLTVEVKVKLLVEVETSRRLVVPELITDCKLVVVDTPFTEEVSTVPEVESRLEVITEVVAISPLMFVVKTLSVTLWEKELMILVAKDETPLTIVWKKFPVEEAVLEVMTEVVAEDPPTSEVRMLF